MFYDQTGPFYVFGRRRNTGINGIETFFIFKFFMEGRW